MAFTPTVWTNGSGNAINATNLNNISNALAQNVDYQTPTVVGTEIQVVKYSTSDIIKFHLTSAVTGGNVTISTDGGVTSIALKDGEGNDITEIPAGLVEVAYVTPFFILRSGGGIKSFFGDGSDGTIPNLNTITTAPNGGTVANLWDMNAGTVFTTGTLSSASDQVVFSIDFGRPYLLNNMTYLYSTSISSGTNRTLALEYSDDSLTWTQAQTVSVSTTPTVLGNIGANGTPRRYWRFVLRAGGSNCTLTMQGLTLNYIASLGDTQTTKVWRIIEPSTLNGAAVVKQYTEYNLPVGYEHTVQNPCQGLVIYSQGDATVNGVLDMSQKAGLAPNGNAIPMLITKKAFKTAYTESLLHFDNNITDDNGRVWTNNGGVTFDATNKKFGTHAISFNGTNQWINTPASDDFSFGNEDFTIDFWVRPTTAGTITRIFGDMDSSSNNGTLYGYKNADNTIQVVVSFTDGTTTSVRSITTLSINTFYHIVVIRNGNYIDLYLNGILEARTFIGSSIIKRTSTKFAIGRNGEYASNYFAGQIDEFRIVKGKAMYTANFTPPTSAYVYQATYVDEPKTLEKYFQLTNVLQTLRGGYGGNGSWGGGYSGSTGRQTSVGIGGAGRQNLGGFGGGGSGGANNSVVIVQGGIGGSVTNAELGGGKLPSKTINTGSFAGMDGYCGSGAMGAYGGGTSFTFANGGQTFGGGGGGGGGSYNTNGNNATDGQYAGGFIMLISAGNISNSGTIRANGGAGGNGSNGIGGNSGGGSSGGGSGGGCIAIFNKGTYSNTGTIQVNGGVGGTAGTGIGTGEAGGVGTSGSVGTIHIQQI